ncbi:hypothetical protein B484DRAFT_430175 [Ochromonadaceae sp. CCMP2298]|nr:hypothetical protein B484DRAFT_430175 [Ochromonadaceae sp. CCMP2298]
MYSEQDILELARKVRADPSKRLTAGKVSSQFINSLSTRRDREQVNLVTNLKEKINKINHLLATAPVAEPVTLSTELWRARVLLMRMENLRIRNMEQTERLRMREEEAREQTERLRMREEEAREQGERRRMREEEAREQTERLRMREEEAREQGERRRMREEEVKLSYSAVINSSLHQRNIVRNRVLLAEDLQAYIKRGEWGHVLPQKHQEIVKCAEHCSKAVSTGLESRLKQISRLLINAAMQTRL